MKIASSFAQISHLDFDVGLERLKKAGYDGLELSNSPIITDPFIDGRARRLTDKEMAGACKRAADYADRVKQAGLEVIGFVPGCFTLSYFEPDFFENYYRIAQALGSPNLKLAGTIYQPGPGKTYWDLVAENHRKLEALSRYGEKYQVRGLIELHHGYLNESCSGAYQLLKDFDPKVVGVIHDPQNMVIAGKERWRMGLEILGDYLAYVHVKNSVFARAEPGKWKWVLSDLNDGLVDWEEFILALQETGYDGYLCNEYMGDRKTTPDHVYIEDVLNSLKQLLKNA